MHIKDWLANATQIKAKYIDMFSRHGYSNGEHLLDYKFAHIVWSDENFERHHIEWCNNVLANERRYYSLDDNIHLLISCSLDELLELPDITTCEGYSLWDEQCILPDKEK